MRKPRVPLDRMEQIAQGIDHAEGICLTPAGELWVSGEKGQLYRIEADGSATEVASTGGWTLGLASDAEGRIYACDAVARRVWRFDPRDGALEPYSDGPPDEPFVAPNWGAFGRDGTYYVSDSGGWKGRDGRLIVVRPGRTAEVWSRESVDFPNGLAVHPGGRELWVLESTPGRLVSFEIREDGSAGPRRSLLELEGTVPDGIAFATDGSVVIACYRPDAIYRWQPGGEIELLGHDPEGTVLAAPTNCVFAGPELDTIAVPNIGRWHVTRFRVAGLRGVPLFYPTAEQLGG